MTRTFGLMLGACALLVGCNSASEEQLVENTVGNVLAQQGQGTVQRVDLTKGADNNYSGMATVRRADGVNVQLNCTARRGATAGNFDILCGQVLDQALIDEIKASLRASLTGQNLTVTQLELTRRDDNNVTGTAEVSDASGQTARLNCSGARQANGRFNATCEQADAPTGAAAAPASEEAPAEEAPADAQ